MTPSCLEKAWKRYAGELKGYFLNRLNHGDVEELLQDVFIKALKQSEGFCEIANPRAWLFLVAKNAMADRLRKTHLHDALDEDIPAPEPEPKSTLDDLALCLPRVLSELSEADRLAISLCDIEGKPQQELADRLGVSLSGAKSRIQRARQRLRAAMEQKCQVRFDEDGAVCCFTPRPPL